MSEGLKPYPAYKDSGVPWLGNVPSHWQLLPLSAAATPKSICNCTDRELLSVYLDRGVIRFSDVDAKRTNVTSEDLSRYQAVDPGNLVLNNQQAWRGSVGVSKLHGIVSPAYIVLRLSQPIDRRYANYLFRDSSHVDQYMINSKGVGSIQRNLYWQTLKRGLTVRPPIDEQIAIANYLDESAVLVSRFIRNRRRLIEVLTEQKQAIVHQAVTRGLDPAAKLKPSGIDWLGDIPEHWELVTANRIMREVDERSKTGEEELLSVSHLTGVTPRSQKNITMFMAASYVGHKLCRVNDLAVNTMWVWMGALGVSQYEGIVSSSYSTYRWTSSEVYGPFYDHVLRIPIYRHQYKLRSKGIRDSRLRLYPDQFLKLPLPLPPYDEQQLISGFIEDSTKTLRTAIEIAEREITLIREYRTRLIADVVTGKLDVRGLAPLAPSGADDLPDDWTDESADDELSADEDSLEAAETSDE